MSASTSRAGSPLTRITAGVARGAVGIARLPLTAVEAASGRRGSGWPPAVAFASVQASVLQLVGAVLHDERLAEQGRAAQQAATRTSRSARLDAAAAATETQARRRRAATGKAIDHAADEARQRAERSHEQVERAERNQREQVERAGRTRQAKVRQRADAETKQRRTRERADRLAVLDEAEQAQEAADAALKARTAATEAEDAFEGARTRRRAT